MPALCEIMLHRFISERPSCTLRTTDPRIIFSIATLCAFWKIEPKNERWKYDRHEDNWRWKSNPLVDGIKTLTRDDWNRQWENQYKIWTQQREDQTRVPIGTSRRTRKHNCDVYHDAVAKNDWYPVCAADAFAYAREMLDGARPIWQFIADKQTLENLRD